MRKLTKISCAFSAVMAVVLGSFVFGQQNEHWSYHGATGPEHWGDLNTDYATCANGKHQSPVNIAADAGLDPASIEFNYEPSAINMINNGHSIQVNYDQGSWIRVRGQQYELLQFHFHAHSEHTVNGKYDPMELHLVHKNEKGQLTVVAVLLVSGKENPAYRSILAHLPKQRGMPETLRGLSVNASELLPADRTHWRYIGSLTTPPCTEGVQWLVMKTRVQLSDAQIKQFTSIFPDNFRPLQLAPAND